MINKLINLANILDESGLKKEADRILSIIKESAAESNKIPAGQDWVDFTRWIYRNKRDRMNIDTTKYKNIQMAEISRKLKERWGDYILLYKDWYSKFRKKDLNDYTSDGKLTGEEVLNIGREMEQAQVERQPYPIQQTFDWGE